MPVPLDVPSLRRLWAEGQDFRWPVVYEDYLSLAKSFRIEVIQALSAEALDESERVVIQASLGSVLNDGERLLKSLLEIETLERSGDEIIFDEKYSALFGYLRSANNSGSEKANRALQIFADYKHVKIKPHTLKDSAVWHLTCLQMLLRGRGNRFDQQNEAALFSEFSSGKAEKVQLLRPERWPLPGKVVRSPRIDDLVQQVISAFHRVLIQRHFSSQRVERAAQILKEQVLTQFSLAMSELGWLERGYLAGLFGKALVGGTPKRIGRLLAYRYLRSGKKVIRFSHGGDRVFFDDPLWQETELPFVSEYYVHGYKAAELLNARYKRKPRTFASHIPQFKSLGSREHFAWYDKDRSTKRECSKRLRVVFVPGSFLGEESFASLDFKLPDVLAADLQRKITVSLLGAGFETWIKPHPKGLFSLAGQTEIDGAKVLKGAFDPTKIEADCFVFEFAGSAFFDALASGKGVVLVDTKHRTWDEAAKIELKKRCKIVPTSFDDYNRLQVSDSMLKQAIESASHGLGCSHEFAHEFFVGKKLSND
ncbi:hypothetical protein [uncultured Thalassospira sp.]|uniref:hypothetical protein n=1 Tax=uncultured Thalassospira sp. TaxID=404382 RepID=UPI0032B1D371|tara:strand:- start:11453 stop:13066 length:1614 start_codon:yes stop_codon:yes gene_type:complete